MGVAIWGVVFGGTSWWYSLNVQFLEAWTAIKAFTDAFGKEAKSARNTATPQPSRSAGKEGSKGDLSSPFS